MSAFTYSNEVMTEKKEYKETQVQVQIFNHKGDLKVGNRLGQKQVRANQEAGVLQKNNSNQ